MRYWAEWAFANGRDKKRDPNKSRAVNNGVKQDEGKKLQRGGDGANFELE